MDPSTRILISRLRSYTPHEYDPALAEEFYRNVLKERRKKKNMRRVARAKERKEEKKAIFEESFNNEPKEDISFYREKIKKYFGG